MPLRFSFCYKSQPDGPKLEYLLNLEGHWSSSPLPCCRFFMKTLQPSAVWSIAGFILLLVSKQWFHVNVLFLKFWWRLNTYETVEFISPFFTDHTLVRLFVLGISGKHFHLCSFKAGQKSSRFEWVNIDEKHEHLKRRLYLNNLIFPLHEMNCLFILEQPTIFL